jgi:GT2 family glycosyltransferase
MENDIIVSVIVPCYNSELTIRACLTAILAQETTASLNVIVVDSSEDPTAQIVEQEFPTVQLIRRTQRTYAGAARNVGLRATEAKFCVLIDSDCIAAPDLVERMLQRHAEANYAAVGGSVENGTPQSLSGWIGYLLEFKEFMPSTPPRSVQNVPTGNAAYRREVFTRCGYFDDDLELTEDLLLNWKLHQAGEQLFFDPTASVTHLNRTGWQNVFGYQIRLGRTAILARRRGDGLGFRGDDQFIRYPLLVGLMPFARLKNAAVWLAKYDFKALLLFLFVWPLYLIGAGFWSYGFYQGLKDDRV